MEIITLEMLYQFPIIAVKITTNGLKQHKFIIPSVDQKSVFSAFRQSLCLGQNQGVGRGAVLSGGSEEKSASKPIQVFG